MFPIVSMRLRIRHAWVFVLILLYSIGVVTPVYAHALLLRSNPAANADLPEAPAQVELFFSESVDPSLSTISVYDSTGKAVDLGDVRVDPTMPTRMTVSLGSLQPGVYTVAWKAISATDGHLTSGSFPFAIGNVNPAVLAAQTTTNSSQLPASALISKWLVLACLALLVGQLPFITLIWNPTVKSTESIFSSGEQDPQIWRSLSEIALIGLLVGLALSILSEAGQATAHELAWPWSVEAGRIVLDSRLGLIWLGRLGLAMFEIWLIKSRITNWKPWAVFATGLTLLFTISLTAHAATETNPALPIISDWLHLTAMCFWLGGIVYLLTGLGKLRNLEGIVQTRLVSRTAGRFSVMAIIAVGVIGVTGLYAAYLRVGSIAALYTSLYGEILLVKQLFVGSLLFLAAINLLYITPRLKRSHQQGIDNTALVSRFRKMVYFEVILAGLLLACVSLLTYLPPAKINPPVTDLVDSTNVADLQVQLTISPGYVGQNTFKVQLASDGQAVRAVKEAVLRFTPSQSNVSPSEVQLLAQGDGTYTTKGSYLSLPSDWQVQAIIRRDNKFDAYANFNFSVSAPGASRESSFTPNIAGGLAILDGLLFALALFSLKAGRSLQFGIGGILTLSMMVLGVFYLTRPVMSVNSQANPIAPSPQSVAAGQAVYVSRCVGCHGTTGKGDGPLGLALIPRPANLQIHGVPGVHTDAALFDWITNGFPGSAMPAWKNVLSDTDRWNLVNFIRTLPPKTQP